MIELLIMAICLFINALLSGVEMAFVTVGKPQLRILARKGNKEASLILALRDTPERTLSVLQVGITLVGVFAAAVGGAGAEESLNPILENRFGFSEQTAEIITILAVTLPYTFLSVILGELVPKSIALKNPVWLILKSAHALGIFERALSPVITFLESSTKAILRPFRLKSPHEAAHGEEPLDLETLTQEHRQYMLNLFNIRRKTVRDVMVPWSEVVSVNITQHSNEIAETIHDSGHTRIPVIDTGEIVGLLHTKEYMAFKSTGQENWQQMIRPAIRVPVNSSLLRTLRLMQEKRTHLSIAYFGSHAVGIVTMEDIFEEIIGDILDENDEPPLKEAQ